MPYTKFSHLAIKEMYVLFINRSLYTKNKIQYGSQQYGDFPEQLRNLCLFRSYFCQSHTIYDIKEKHIRWNISLAYWVQNNKATGDWYYHCPLKSLLLHVFGQTRTVRAYICLHSCTFLGLQLPSYQCIGSRRIYKWKAEAQVIPGRSTVLDDTALLGEAKWWIYS